MKLQTSEKETHPFFTKEWVATDFATTKLSVKEYCQKYGGEDHWRKYFNKLWLWRKADPEFDRLITQNMTANGMRETRAGGRPSKEEEQPTWREDFCAALLKENGNREKASHATPYSLKTLIQKLNVNYTSYDKEFSEMVRATELTISAKAEEMLNRALAEFEDGKIAMDRAKILDVQARIAEKIVQKMDHERWGKRMNLEVSGQINHKLIPQGERIARIMTEQRDILRGKGLDLPLALKEPEPQVIDVEAEEIE